VLENYLEKYIEDLYQKQNNGAETIQHGLFSKKDYYELLKPVIELVSKHKDYSLEEMRNNLFIKNKWYQVWYLVMEQINLKKLL